MQKLMKSRIWTMIGNSLDYFLLNFLWILCSIPIITIGASTTAVSYASLKLLTDGDGSAVQNFFHAFRSNLKQATLLWLVALAVFGILALDLSLCFRYSEVNPTLIALVWVMLFSFLLLASLALMYLFPLQCWFENTLWATIKHAVVLSVHHLGLSIVLAAVTVLIVFLAICIQGVILFVPGILAVVYGIFFRHLFKKYTTAQENRTCNAG